MTYSQEGYPLTAAISPRVQVVESTESTNADVVRQLRVARVAHHRAASADDDRRFGLRDIKVIEQLVDARVVLKVNPRERDAMSRQEFANAVRIFGEPRPHHARTDQARFLKQLTARQECTQQDVAQHRHLVKNAA